MLGKLAPAGRYTPFPNVGRTEQVRQKLPLRTLAAPLPSPSANSVPCDAVATLVPI